MSSNGEVRSADEAENKFEFVNPTHLNNESGNKIKKSSFSLREQNSGNILTVHHTIKENNKMLRIVLSACCFDLRGTHMVAIDRRGCIFIFNFTTKRYWRHDEKVQKPSVVVASKKHNQYVIGTKEGIIALLDVEMPGLKQNKISEDNIKEISYPGQPLEPHNLALICTTQSALLININTLNCSYRLDFDNVMMSLKFASFLPNSDQIMTSFTNDTLHIWSGVSLEVVRIVYPLKLRDKKLQLREDSKIEVPEFTLDPPTGEFSNHAVCLHHYSNKNLIDGSIATYAYRNDTSALILSTWDNFLLILSIYTFELTKMYRLKDFVLLQLAVLAKPNESFIMGLTNRKTVVLLDCENVEYKLHVQLDPSRYISLSSDNKYLAIAKISGEISVWCVGHLLVALKTQKQCMTALKTAFKQRKPIKMSNSSNETKFQEELKKLLTYPRLKQILQEYHCYPSKYRVIIWCSILQLPNNRRQYIELLQMGQPLTVSAQAKRIQMKNATLKRSLVKCWACLAQWCKVLAYSEILPGLIFPFVKMFQQNPITAFEVCCTLIQNQFQLFFEYHPLEPANYLGICANILQHFENSLYEFYKSKDVTATTFAWLLLKNAFSEVLDEGQWLCLWDNVISAPPYYLCFVVVAYNILLKEVIIRLPDKNIIEIFFKEQNPIDVKKLISKSFKLLNKCPETLHPQKFFSQFQNIPQNAYPKFFKYPQKSLKKYEEKIDDLRKVDSILDARMRELELQELQLMKSLENGLRQEEHAKRMKEIETVYQNALKREEERINCQRKMLLLYQKEIRQRKGEVVAVLKDSTKRKAILQKEQELHCLQNHLENERRRNDLNLMFAEEELHNYDMEFLSQNLLEQSLADPLKSKYCAAIKQLSQEQKLLNNDLRLATSFHAAKTSDNYLDDVELKLDKIQNEFQILAKLT